MIDALLSLPTRDDPDDMTDRLATLISEKSALQALVNELKAREQRYVSCISQMLNTPATSVASAKFADGQWEVLMTTGAVWQRRERCISTETEHRYVDVWTEQEPIPGTRHAIANTLRTMLAQARAVA